MSECLARPPSCAGVVVSAAGGTRQMQTVVSPDGAHATTHSMAWRGVVEVQKPMARMPVADRWPKGDLRCAKQRRTTYRRRGREPTAARTARKTGLSRRLKGVQGGQRIAEGLTCRPEAQR